MLLCQSESDTSSISDSSSFPEENTNPLEECLLVNNQTDISLSLSSCTTYNQGNTIEKEQSKKYCCLLKITYESNKEYKACMTITGELDIIDERKEILRLLDRTIKTVSIDCSAKYLHVISFISILLLINTVKQKAGMALLRNIIILKNLK